MHSSFTDTVLDIPLPSGWRPWISGNPVLLIDGTCAEVRSRIAPAVFQTGALVLEVDCHACKTADDFIQACRRDLLALLRLRGPVSSDFGANWDAFDEYVCEFDFYDETEIVVLFCGFGSYSLSDPAGAKIAVEICGHGKPDGFNYDLKDIAYLFLSR